MTSLADFPQIGIEFPYAIYREEDEEKCIVSQTKKKPELAYVAHAVFNYASSAWLTFSKSFLTLQLVQIIILPMAGLAASPPQFGHNTAPWHMWYLLKS